MGSYQSGDPVRLTRTSYKGQCARFVEASTHYPGSAWVAIDAKKPLLPPGRHYYTDQTRTTRKLVPLHYLQPLSDLL